MMVQRQSTPTASLFVWLVASASGTLLALAGVDISATLHAQQPPALTGAVNDFANVIGPAEEAELTRISRTLQAATGDVLVTATVSTVEPYADPREFAVELFENRGRGIGERGKDNGVLILLALKERRVEVEVGYALEEWVTDGYAGETSREFMAPEFRNGRYGAGLVAGATRIATRIAEGRNVPLTGVEPLPTRRQQPQRTGLPLSAIIVFLILMAVLGRIGRPPRRGIRRWGRSGWSGWSSGVGPFGGGGFGGGFGGGGFGGGFGGFGGGRSGGGGGGAGW
jgi:uncharacterized protein